MTHIERYDCSICVHKRTLCGQPGRDGRFSIEKIHPAKEREPVVISVDGDMRSKSPSPAALRTMLVRNFAKSNEFAAQSP